MAALTADGRHMRSWAAVLALCAAVVLAGCTPRDPGEGLEGIDWRLAGSSASSVEFKDFEITVRFEDGVLKGRSAVNSYSAKYSLKADGSLTTRGLQATAMAGSPEAMKAEEVYLALLRAVRSFAIVEGTLRLKDPSGNELLVFQKAAVAAGRTESPAPEAPAGPEASAEVTSSPPSTAVSEASAAYARSIGGTSHRGELLYFIVGAVHTTEAAATADLNGALPAFGDMQSYFIVQRSDNLAGMTRGQWVIVEAYRNPPDDPNVQLAKRAFPDATVRRATVVTGDPIPVYEDLVR